MVLAVLSLAILSSLPHLRGLLDRRALDGAAARLASGVANVRHRAIAANRHAGMFIVRDQAGDRYTIHLDGGQRGIRTAEVLSGVDPAVEGPIPIGIEGGGVRLGIPLAPPVPRIPPSGGFLTPGGDPVRLGPSDILSYSPIGESTTGTLYLTDGSGGVRAVVVYGRSGRIRVWAWEPGRQWQRQ